MTAGGGELRRSLAWGLQRIHGQAKRQKMNSPARLKQEKPNRVVRRVSGGGPEEKKTVPKFHQYWPNARQRPLREGIPSKHRRGLSGTKGGDKGCNAGEKKN